jgi:3-hydroxyisobutyrate dehydrogenase-like beta-hydroxyacid dehydrogenase
MHVGFIGLGIMGAPMALNIRKRGHTLTVYNRTPGKDRALIDAGAKAVAAPQDIGAVDVLITCVADGPAEEAMLLESGLIDRLPQESIHVSCTTMGVDTARKLTAAHNKRKRVFIAAPARRMRSPAACRCSRRSGSARLLSAPIRRMPSRSSSRSISWG